MIEIYKKDDVYLRIKCEKDVSLHLRDYFSFYTSSYKFNPLYKKGLWDGKIKLWNAKEGKIYLGLLNKVLHFFKEFKYEVTYIDPELNPPQDDNLRDKFLSFMKDVRFYDYEKKEIHPRAYQLESIFHMIKNPLTRTLLVSPTSSGKSLMIYALIRWFSPKIKKILLIVPRINLVNQMYNDFGEYSVKDDWMVHDECHRIQEGVKDSDKKVIISTWQSVYKQPKSWFDQFEMLIVDECHEAEAKSISGIAEKMTKCPIKFGTTGTLKNIAVHKLVLEGLFGPIYTSTTTKELMDAGFISKLDINCLLLQHNDADKKQMARCKYPDEIEYLINHKKRNNFITNLCISQKGNSLVLFHRKIHGEDLLRSLMDKKSGKEIHLIYGATLADERELIRKYTFKNNNNVLVASYGVFSTGANIPNLQNVILAHPHKSEIRNLQSIGRGLRLDGKENKVKLFDVADDLSRKKWINYSLRHFKERIKIYNQEKFDYKIYPIPI